LCPPDCFNMWTDFVITQHDNYTKSEAAVERFIDLVDILSGHQETTREYMLDWIAHMFQYPEQKTTMPTIVSAEGAGKGTLMDILTGMMGENKVYQTTTPSREVFGNFNGPMSDAFLVNLNEVSASEMKGSSGKLKALITDNQMTINEKGVKQIQITSYAKFIVTTNNDEAIKPTRGDRRNIMMYAADDLIKVGMNDAHIANATEKIKALREIIDSKDSLRSIYDYLMEREGLDGFGSKPPPMTQFQEEQQLLTLSAIEVWLKDWIVSQEGSEVTLTSAKCFETFMAWTKTNMPEYSCTSMQFGVRLTRLKIKGVTSIRNRTTDRVFNINDMYEHFGVSRD
jgi:phage/plasmid-associated DNA primase